jgi:hypothetical protein
MPPVGAQYVSTADTRERRIMLEGAGMRAYYGTLSLGWGGEVGGPLAFKFMTGKYGLFKENVTTQLSCTLNIKVRKISWFLTLYRAQNMCPLPR